MLMRMTAAMFVRTAGILGASVFRMDILTAEAFDEGNHKTPAAAAAGMHVKTYDTHRVPYDQQQCGNLCKQSFHLNLQSYKIVPRFQIQNSIVQSPAVQ